MTLSVSFSLLVLFLFFWMTSRLAHGTRETASTHFLRSVALMTGFFGIQWLISRRTSLSISISSTILQIIAFTVVVSLLIRMVDRRGRREETECDIEGSTSESIVGMLTVIIVVIGFFYLFSKTTGTFAVLPNHDALNHVTMTRNIIEYGALNPESTFSNPIRGPGIGGDYPLGFHALAAFVSQISSQTPTQSVSDITILSLTVLWPVSIFLLARSLQLRPTSASFAAASSLLFYLFPIGPLSWGGVAMTHGVIAMLALTALSIRTARSGRISGWMTVLIGAIGLLALQPSTFFAWLFLSAFLVVPELRSSSDRLLTPLFSILVFGIAFSYPFIEKVTGFGLLLDSTANVSPNTPGAPYVAMGQALGLSVGFDSFSVWPLILLASGMTAIVLTGRFKRVFVAYIAHFGLVMLAALADRAPWDELSQGLASFYRQYQRVSYLLVPLVSLLAAVAFQVVSEKASEGLARFGPVSRCISFSVLGSFLLTAMSPFITVHARDTYRQVVTTIWNGYAVLKKDELSLPDSVVDTLDKAPFLASFDSGAGYYYTSFGLANYGTPFLYEKIVERDSMLGGLTQLATNVGVRDLFVNSGTDVVFTNRKAMSGTPNPSPELLVALGNFKLIYGRGNIGFWKINDVVYTLREGAAGIIADSTGGFQMFAGRTATINFVSMRSSIDLTTMPIRLLFRNNDCRSVSTIKIGERTIPVTAGPFALVDLKAADFLEGRDSGSITVEVNGEDCTIPESGEPGLPGLHLTFGGD